ncbi:endonuclease III [Aureimonas leprariae]|nr:endonuclease III [Aureimonas leprariae]
MAEKSAPGRASSAKSSGGKSSRAPKPAKAPPAIPYSPADVEEIFRRLHVQRPNPTSELEHYDPFTFLVAVVLSAQMTDVGVNRATRRLFPLADTPAAMAALEPERIFELIGNVSFARTKSGNLVKLSRRLVEEHGGVVPRSIEALIALPGVGPKTARVVLNTCFGEKYLGVDTHIFRIGNRLKIAPGRTPDEVERNFLAIIPKPYLAPAHHLLLLHGRYVCKARKPDCPACVIADLCRADEKWNSEPAPLIRLPDHPPGLQGTPQAKGELPRTDGEAEASV